MRRKPGPRPRKKPGADFSDPYSFQTLLARYAEHQRICGYSKETLRSGGNALKLFSLWCAERGVVKPAEVTRALLERYQRHLVDYEYRKDHRLTLRSQLARLSCVRGFFRYLSRQNLLLHNPAAEIDLPRTPKRLPGAVLSVAEAEKILCQPRISDPVGLRDRAILETLYSTAMRRLELTRLKLQDLDAERGLVLVREGKGRKDRLIPIGERAQLWIAKYVEEVRPRLVASPDAGFLFLATHGEPLAAKSLTELVHRYVVRAEIGKVGSCHIFRHTAATLMLEGGADIRFIQAMLGHADIASTQIYTRVAVGQLKAVHARTHPGAALRFKPAGGEDANTSDEHAAANPPDRENVDAGSKDASEPGPGAVNRVVDEPGDAES